jgi:NAD+ synthase (glutamine-hydrolysing)
MKNYGFVKCAIANFNGKIGNPAENAKKIKAQILTAEERHAKILVFPELCLTGYTCQDLFETTHLMEECMTQINQIRKFTLTKSILVLIGAPLNVNDDMYNCAIAIKHGKILGVVPKRFIPNYKEFYEARWFSHTSLTEIELFGKKIPFGNLIFSSISGYRLGVEICEDLWAPIPPSSELALAGANILANLSASNELVGKNEYRKQLVKSQSASTISAYLYTSAGFSESTADLVFGGSGYAYENGKELAHLERFEITDQMEIFDVDVEYLTNERRRNKTFADSKHSIDLKKYRIIPVEEINLQSSYAEPDNNSVEDGFVLTRKIDPHPFIPNIMNESGGNVCKEILSIQSTALARRLYSIGCKTVTIGVSGGLDSTLALLVCYEAFLKLNLETSGIIGITMPGFGTTNRTYNNSLKLCEELGTTLKVIPIKDVCTQSFKDLEHDPSVHDITYENVQARARTSILMNMANKMGGILVGTGDLSELMLGWCTYNGDHMSMYNVNCSIPKTLVKYLIEWYARFGGEHESLNNILLDIIDTPISPELLPSDGTKIVQKTESTVGPYELIDFFIYYWLRNGFDGRKTVFLAKHAFKNKYDEGHLISYYNDFIKRAFNNQFKRNCVPDGPKVGSISVSPRGDLRMPSDASFVSWQI